MSEVNGDATVDAHRFAPAAPDEEYVYGACAPGWHAADASEAVVDEWVAFVRDQGIERVCCLLSGSQPRHVDADPGRYAEAFGPENVKHAPIPDHSLADPETLNTEVLPFLEESVERRDPVVVHCLAGLGRTGHVLAAWLVAGRDYDPVDAIETVEAMGRRPGEAVETGGARRGELHDLLTKVE